jgi:hypothetical protein
VALARPCAGASGSRQIAEEREKAEDAEAEVWFDVIAPGRGGLAQPSLPDDGAPPSASRGERTVVVRKRMIVMIDGYLGRVPRRAARVPRL